MTETLPNGSTTAQVATTAIQNLNALSEMYAGLDSQPNARLRRAENPSIGAHQNLAVLGDIAEAIDLYTSSTGRHIILDETYDTTGYGADLAIGPIRKLTTEGFKVITDVYISTAEGKIIPIDDSRIETIFNRNRTEGLLVRRALLLTRLGKNSPQELINKTKRQIESDAKPSRIEKWKARLTGK